MRRGRPMLVLGRTVRPAVCRERRRSCSRRRGSIGRTAPGSRVGGARERCRRRSKLDTFAGDTGGSGRIGLFGSFGSGGSHSRGERGERWWLRGQGVGPSLRALGSAHRPRNAHPPNLAPASMSLDIDWSLLSDPALTDGIVDAFNRYLATADRPSFLGPISVTSFDFGSRAPDVEVVGLGDVYPDFLADDEDETGTEDGGESSLDGAGGRWQDGMSSVGGGGRSGSREWSHGGSHPARHPSDGFGRDGYGFPRQEQQQADDVFSAMGSRARSTYGAVPGRDRSSSVAGGPFASSPIAGFRPTFASVYSNRSPFTSRVGLSSALPTPMATPFLSRNPSYASLPLVGGGGPVSRGGSPSSHLGGPDYHATTPDEHPGDRPPSKSGSSGAPSLQLHVRIHHQADIRFSLSTMLLINHPSPAFMSLPLTLTVTEVEVDWHVVLAYQAELERPAPGPSIASRGLADSNGRRVHLSILDPLDPYGPPAPGTSTPPTAPHLGESKTPPAGERLIPRMSMESSIGQEGDRVLRNVAKVERCVFLPVQGGEDLATFPADHSYPAALY